MRESGDWRLGEALVWICSRGTPSPASGEAEGESGAGGTEGDTDRRRILSPSCCSQPIDATATVLPHPPLALWRLYFLNAPRPLGMIVAALPRPQHVPVVLLHALRRIAASREGAKMALVHCGSNHGAFPIPKTRILGLL